MTSPTLLSSLSRISLLCTTLLLLVVLLLWLFNNMMMTTTTTTSVVLFDPVIPSPQEIDAMYASTQLPEPIEITNLSLCKNIDFHWLASDRDYWDGWTSKSMFMKPNGQFTRKNVYIQKEETVCILVMLIYS
ncbi:uncharacterized protein BX663DRAFT_199039 [Cokeromyces recurvatus]|uniref:uncharacterized protein n=1 Tax=Cokeromyces recurvatus TaxID=90255 RepID=UPI0022202203|nr:uncharacterized protein BX663DRAFT_199039 [Cokeromyces recurvatus]KAI7906613.1 hypothetical protein BX663DRAFT_199039 [Cokeromyces recurvatus]